MEERTTVPISPQQTIFLQELMVYSADQEIPFLQNPMSITG
jgi:hypothetical protein